MTPHPDANPTDAEWRASPAITGANRRTLDRVFHNPVEDKLRWDDVVALVRHIGHVEERSNNNFVFKVGRELVEMRKPHTHQLTAPELMAVRQFLSRCGRWPEARDERARDVTA